MKIFPGLLTEEVFKQVCIKFFPFNSSSSLYFNHVFTPLLVSSVVSKSLQPELFAQFVRVLLKTISKYFCEI